MKKEIEIKVGPIGDASRWAEVLEAKFRKVDESHQIDVYYTSRFRDLIASEECLRVRTTENKQEITWKPPTSSKMKQDVQFWKEEIDVPFLGDPSNVDRLLQNIDMVKYVTVEKRRTTFRVDSQTIVALDQIENLGAFLEIETISDDVDSARIKNKRLVTDLGISDAELVAIPYRDLVADALGITALSEISD